MLVAGNPTASLQSDRPADLKLSSDVGCLWPARPTVPGVGSDTFNLSG